MKVNQPPPCAKKKKKQRNNQSWTKTEDGRQRLRGIVARWDALQINENRCTLPEFARTEGINVGSLRRFVHADRSKRQPIDSVGQTKKKLLNESQLQTFCAMIVQEHPQLMPQHVVPMIVDKFGFDYEQAQKQFAAFN